jgi:hypothetical protein
MNTTMNTTMMTVAHFDHIVNLQSQIPSKKPKEDCTHIAALDQTVIDQTLIDREMLVSYTSILTCLKYHLHLW